MAILTSPGCLPRQVGRQTGTRPQEPLDLGLQAFDSSLELIAASKPLDIVAPVHLRAVHL